MGRADRTDRFREKLVFQFLGTADDVQRIDGPQIQATFSPFGECLDEDVARRSVHKSSQRRDLIVGLTDIRVRLVRVALPPRCHLGERVENADDLQVCQAQPQGEIRHKRKILVEVQAGTASLPQKEGRGERWNDVTFHQSNHVEARRRPGMDERARRIHHIAAAVDNGCQRIGGKHTRGGIDRVG